MADQELIIELERSMKTGLFIVPEVNRLPRSVETTAKNIENQFPVTIEALRHTAVQLEEKVKDLRDRATLLEQQLLIAKEIREVVEYEREAWDEVVRLSLVPLRAREEV